MSTSSVCILSICQQVQNTQNGMVVPFLQILCRCPLCPSMGLHMQRVYACSGQVAYGEVDVLRDLLRCSGMWSLSFETDQVQGFHMFPCYPFKWHAACWIWFVSLSYSTFLTGRSSKARARTHTHTPERARARPRSREDMNGQTPRDANLWEKLRESARLSRRSGLTLTGTSKNQEQSRQEPPSAPSQSCPEAQTRANMLFELSANMIWTPARTTASIVL